MRFTNSLRLLMENFKQVYKILLFKAGTALILTALCSALIIPELWEIIQNPVTQDLWENVKNIFLAFFDHEQGKSPSFYVEAVFGKGGSLMQLLDVLFSMRWGLVLACVGCVLVYLLKCFVDEVVHFSVGSSLNDRMATYADTPFSTAFVANLGKASAYAGLYVPVTFVADLITFGIICVLLRFLNIFAALFLSMTLLIVLQALKLSATGHWLPAMTTDNKTLKDAIWNRSQFEKKQFGKVFFMYLVTLYVVIIVNVVAAVCTFGSALLITVPTSYLLFICEQYVIYYTITGKKYFITYETIATNPDRGDHAHFFDYMEEAEKNSELETE